MLQAILHPIILNTGSGLYSYLSKEEAASPSASVERPHPGEVEGAGRALLPRPRWPALAAPLPAGESDDPATAFQVP